MTLKDWFIKAQAEHFALGAFNVANLETLKAVVNAATKLHSPVIVEASPGEINYLGGKNLISLVKNIRQETNLPIFTNLDHSPDSPSAEQGLAWGFNLIHLDNSHLPFEENLKDTQSFTQKAHQQNILVEGEFDTVTGSSSPHPNQDSQNLLSQSSFTDPLKAQQFVAATEIDTLAISIGNIHGLYQKPIILNLELLEQIRQKVNCFFSLHGGSGTQNDQIKAAIDLGIVKININTELRLAFHESLETTLRQSQEIAIYKIMPDVITAVQKVVETKINLFGSANKIT